MKTALQELQQIIGNNEEMVSVKWLKSKIDILLSIEKKQIIDAYLSGAHYTCYEEVNLAKEYYDNLYITKL